MHPFIAAADPNIGRAFRIAIGDIAGNVAPLAAAHTLHHCAVRPESWRRLAGRLARCAGESKWPGAEPPILVGGLDYGPFYNDTVSHAWDGASLVQPEAVLGGLLVALQPEGEHGLRGGPLALYGGFGWALGAWEHYLATGDRTFLKVAHAATLGEISHWENTEFDRELGLFRGIAFCGDGISAYPDFWAAGMEGKGHISKWVEQYPEHKAGTGLGLPFCPLSTNCINVQGYRVAARIQHELGLPVDPTLEKRANRLAGSINRHFWCDETGLYRYLVDPFGGSDQQEGFGHAFAILFGIAGPERAARIFENLHRTPQGIPINWPVYPRYRTPDGRTYGNHNGAIWPPVNGCWAEAAAEYGRVEFFAAEIKNHADRACRHNQFAEVSHPVTGKPYGGIQEGRTGRKGIGLSAFLAARLGGAGETTGKNLRKIFPPVPGKPGMYIWQSCGRNTFSATAYLRMALRGLCGLRLTCGGLAFRPTVPRGMGPVSLYDLRYRKAELELHVVGEGRRVKKITINGKRANTISTNARGKHVVIVEMRRGREEPGPVQGAGAR